MTTGLAALFRELGRPITIDYPPHLTPAEAEALLAELRRLAHEGKL
jgi:hypothetical protein